jgi:hypothetical protein
MRDKYFLAWGRDADENGPERDDTIGKIVSIESCFLDGRSNCLDGPSREATSTAQALS